MDILKELDVYEARVNNHESEPAFQQLLRLLTKSSVHRSKRDEIFSHLEEAEVSYIATRIVSTTFQLFLNPSFLLSEEGYISLSYLGRNFALMVAMTPYKNADHVIRHLIGQSEADEQSSGDISIHDFRKMLFLWSINSEVTLPFDDFMRHHNNLMKYVLFNALTTTCYVSSAVHQRREQLLEALAGGTIDLTLDDKSVAFAGPMWMYTTYASTPKKHDAKSVINAAYREWILSKNVNEQVFNTPRKIVEKPTLVVIMEQMNRNHAMFRCFGDSFYALKERFNFIGMGVEETLDQNIYDAFDEVVLFPKDIKKIDQYVDLVVEKSPDMILYVSLGMQNATIPLSTLRLAPIQVMFLAHPAPSRIPTIDYVIIEDGLIQDGTVFSEKKIWMKSGDFVLRDSGDASKVHKLALESRGADTNVVKIGIPSFAMKISDPFVAVLEKISRMATKQVQFHFYPYLVDLPYRWFNKQIEQRLPGSVIHLPKKYGEYLQSLGSCDIHLGPFPFNNSNGNIDSVKMGLPMVVLEQKSTEGSMDSMMLRNMHAPEDAICDSIDKYVERTLKLVDDDEYRREQQTAFEQIDLDATYFNSDKANRIVKAFENLYSFHDDIQASEKTVIKFDEFIAKDSLDSIAT